MNRRKNFALMNRILSSIALSAAVLALASCAKKADDPAPTTPAALGAVGFYFQPVAPGTETDLQYGLLNGNPRYRTATGDSISVDQLRYWISNVQLVRADGSFFAPDSSYHLLESGTGITPKLRFTLKRVPAGSYTAIRFGLGVDSIQNYNNTNKKGDLRDDIGMNWTWSSGYIWTKTEGQFRKTDGTLAPYQLHLGYAQSASTGIPFTSANSGYRIITLSLPDAMTVSSSATPSIHLHVDALAQFGGFSGADFNTNLNTRATWHSGSGDGLKILRNSAQRMFKVDHVH